MLRPRPDLRFFMVGPESGALFSSSLGENPWQTLPSVLKTSMQGKILVLKPISWQA